MGSKIKFKNYKKFKYAYYLGYFTLLILIVEFSLKINPLFLTLTSIIFLLFGLFLMIKSPQEALYLLPLVALSGPIVRFQIFPNVSINFSDIYLGNFIVIFLISFLERNYILNIGKYFNLIGLACFFVLISLVFSLNILISAISAINIIQLICLYVLTLNYIREKKEIDKLLESWIIATTVCSILIVLTYVNGETLLLDTDDSLNDTNSIKGSENSLFRVAFFVTGFIFPLCFSVVTTFVYFLVKEAPKKRSLVFAGLSLIINLITVVLMGNKTVLVSILLSLPIFFFFKNNFLNVAFYKRLAFSLVIILTLGVVLKTGIDQIMPDYQQTLLVESFTSSESLDTRFVIWKNTFLYLINSPFRLLIGVGPDISIRESQNDLFQTLFDSGRGFGPEGAVDSGLLYLLLNYGLCVFTLLSIIITHAMMSLKKIIKRDNELTYVIVLISIISWIIMSITQQSGISKPVFLFIQLMAVTDIIISKRIQFKHI